MFTDQLSDSFFPSLPSLTTSLVATDRLENSRVEGIRESEHARDVMVSAILWRYGEKCVFVSSLFLS